MASPVMRDQVNALEARMTVVETDMRDLSTKMDGGFAALRRDTRGLRHEVASLRGDVLALETEMAEVQETLGGHGRTLASHGEMLASHGEMLREILGQLAKIVPSGD
jgi:predicted  nucleic acid-binding Zn-ribbon protein